MIDLMHVISAEEVKALTKNNQNSHKGENGKLLMIGGSHKYHGAPILALKMASKIVDLVYFASVQENNELVKKMKSELCEFVVLDEAEVAKKVDLVDAVLIGPGLDSEESLGDFVNDLLEKYPEKKFVLDADAFQYLDKNLLNKNVVITPHKGEFEDLFGLDATKENVQKMAKKYDCVIVLKGAEDFIAFQKDFKINKTGNAGMTKGGTGDVLAGLIAGLACKNDLFLAASAGVFLSGLAGDRLQKEVGDYFNASDLSQEIPKAIKWCENFKH